MIYFCLHNLTILSKYVIMYRNYGGGKVIFTNLKHSYVTSDGQELPFVKDYHFEEGERLILGNFIESTHDHEVGSFGRGIGIFLYQDKNNPYMAYRIYRDFKDYNFNNEKEALMIEKLKEINSFFDDGFFPYGVITLGKRVIGQFIVYYPSTINLSQYTHQKGFNYDYMLKAIDILKKLYQSGIIYEDVHGGNFVLRNDFFKIIDFEENTVHFTDSPFQKTYYRNMIQNTKGMIQKLGKDELIHLVNLDKTGSLDEIQEELSIGKRKSLVI